MPPNIGKERTGKIWPTAQGQAAEIALESNASGQPSPDSGSGELGAAGDDDEAAVQDAGASGGAESPGRPRQSGSWVGRFWA